MSDTYTKAEAEDLKRAKQDIELFLRLASDRLSQHPTLAPFVATTGLFVIGWLRALADRYGNGEDITKA